MAADARAAELALKESRRNVILKQLQAQVGSLNLRIVRAWHGVVVAPDGETMLVVAGWPELHDVWASSDGVTWVQTSDAVWNCGAKSCGKFDFWSLYHRGALLTVGGSGASATFGKLYADTWRLLSQDGL